MLLGKNVSQRCVIFFHLNIKDYLSTQNEVAVNVCKKKKKKKKKKTQEKANVKIRRKLSVVYLVALNEV